MCYMDKTPVGEGEQRHTKRTKGIGNGVGQPKGRIEDKLHKEKERMG
jgi:hypothetical protein